MPPSPLNDADQVLDLEGFIEGPQGADLHALRKGRRHTLLVAADRHGSSPKGEHSQSISKSLTTTMS